MSTPVPVYNSEAQHALRRKVVEFLLGNCCIESPQALWEEAEACGLDLRFLINHMRALLRYLNRSKRWRSEFPARLL